MSFQASSPIEFITDYHQSVDISPDFTSGIENSRFTHLADLIRQVRNPLTSINLANEMIEFATNAKDLENYNSIILRNSARIEKLINKIIGYQNANEVLDESFSLHELLDEVLAMSRDQIISKNIKIIKDFAFDDFNLVSNKPELKIALGSIVINAIEAMNPENGELKLVSKLSDKTYTVEISDNGCGISEANLKYIFTSFHSSKFTGLGIGLAAAYSIFQHNHILVNVNSKEGEGTCFTLSFDRVN